MALRIPVAPAGMEQIVRNAMARSAGALGLAGPQMAGMAGGGALAPAAPHEVFSLGLDDIAENRVIAAARPMGWRVLVVGGQGAVAAIEFDAAGGGATAGGGPVAGSFKNINEGPFVEATVEGIHAAEAESKVQQRDYEVRLLEAPAIYLVALWLHRADEDLFRPLGKHMPEGLQGDRFYNEKDLLAAIQPLAKRRQTQDDRPQGSPP